MAEKIRVRITAVRRRTVRITAAAPRAPCPACGREVEAVTTGQAREILEAGGGELCALIDAGRVHAIQTVSGSLRVCKPSLFFK